MDTSLIINLDHLVATIVVVVVEVVVVVLVIVVVVVLGLVKMIIELHNMSAYGEAESTNWNSYQT